MILYYQNMNIQIKKITKLLAASALFLFIGCIPDEDVPDNTDTQANNLIGTWVSTGNDLAPMFSNIVDSLVFNFKADSTYQVRQVDNSGTAILYTGVYHTGSGYVDDTVFPIEVDQTSPEAAQYKGIYEVNKNVTPQELTMDYVETLPNTQYTPPTFQNGFGSGQFGVDGIGKYRKQ